MMPYSVHAKSKIILLWVLSLILFGSMLYVESVQAESILPKPHWSLDVKGGYFYPDIKDWAAYYGDDKTWQVAGSLAYKLIRQIDIGIEGGVAKDRGQGRGVLSGTAAGRVLYDLFPAHAYVIVRGVFNENQWIVPYAGGGFTRMFYRERIELQGTSRGFADGYHGRAGIQLLLDNADQSAANNLFLDYGIHHTYLVFEAQYVRAMADATDAGGSQTTVNLGGTSFLGGLLFEF